MYIKYDNKKYPCKCSIGNNSITYRNLPDDFPTEVSGKIELYADTDFLLREDNTGDYLRQTFENNTLTLTNVPEPQPVEEPEPSVSELEQLRADVDYIAVMTGVEL